MGKESYREDSSQFEQKEWQTANGMCLQCLPSKKSCFCQGGSWRRMTGPDTKYRKEAHDFSVSSVAFNDEAHSLHSQRIALRLSFLFCLHPFISIHNHMSQTHLYLLGLYLWLGHVATWHEVHGGIWDPWINSHLRKIATSTDRKTLYSTGGSGCFVGNLEMECCHKSQKSQPCYDFLFVWLWKPQIVVAASKFVSL